MNAMWKKITAALLSVFLLGAFNFCLVECACASEHHHSEAAEVSSHGNESSHEDHDSDSEKHEDGSACRSSLIADQIPSGGFLGIHSLKSNVLSSFVSVEPFYAFVFHPQFRVEFPPGNSPPAVFLSAYFSHAPPAIL